MSNWRRWMLMSSLALNVFMVGAVLGGAFMWSRVGGDGPVPPIRRPEGLLHASRALSPEFRPIILSAVREAVRDLRPQFEKVREARLEVARLLVEPTLNSATFEAALANGRAADLAVRTGLDRALIKAALKLPPEERKTLARTLRQANTFRAGGASQRQ